MKYLLLLTIAMSSPQGKAVNSEKIAVYPNRTSCISAGNEIMEEAARAKTGLRYRFLCVPMKGVK